MYIYIFVYIYTNIYTSTCMYVCTSRERGEFGRGERWLHRARAHEFSFLRIFEISKSARCATHYRKSL